MKVLHLSESFGWSGGAAQALALAWQLKARGHHNVIACPQGGDLWHKAENAGMGLLNFRPRKDYDLPCALRLARFISEFRPDVVHAHHPKAHAMGLLAKFVSRRQPVFVVTRRVSHPLLKTFFARLKYKSSLVDGYITVADSIRRMFLDYGVSPEKVRTIYSGVDTSRFKPGQPSAITLKELALPPGAPVIGLVGNFSFDKGQHILIEAAARLLKDGKNLILMFAGRDTDSQAMKDLVAAKGVPLENVRLLGLRHDVPELLSVMSISVNCAVKGEALSGSIRESMACGIPVIASDISGNGEIVIEGKTGLLFPPGDDGALYGRLKYALSAPDAVKAMADTGLARVREDFTVEVMARKTFRYYKELLSS